ncbi:hypothetical protein R1sor_022861 [Riccia sorocarpa]|uniref:Uncharacterized protein n=1 Tax=Riccia sorocarpa TaxID=122646 RepID=A0ABD3GL32_9MARC
MTGTGHKTRRNKYRFVRLVVLSHRTFKKSVRPEGRATQGGMMDMVLVASAAPISGRPKRRLSSRNTNASCYGATVANGAYATVANILRELLELERMIPAANVLEIVWKQHFLVRKVEAANIEVAENFRTPLPTALDDNRDRVHETLDDNRRVVLEVNCARCAELFIARKTKFNPQIHGNWVSRNHNRNSIIFKAEHSTTDEKPDAHSAEEQGPPSDVGMQRTNKGNKKI